ncbi:Putative phage protein [Staphylococcus xylosus]|nr:Putative phage protein [Staphylococcus xylosus]
MSVDGTKDIERRVGILEDKDRYNDKRFRNIETTIKEDRKEVYNAIEKLHNSLREIERGQHTQELTNQKMDFTLDSINKERESERLHKEESRKEFKQLKWLIIASIFTLFSSLIIALIRSWLGI